jgi:hypothetical protein
VALCILEQPAATQITIGQKCASGVQTVEVC